LLSFIQVSSIGVVGQQPVVGMLQPSVNADPLGGAVSGGGGGGVGHVHALLPSGSGAGDAAVREDSMLGAAQLSAHGSLGGPERARVAVPVLAEQQDIDTASSVPVCSSGPNDVVVPAVGHNGLQKLPAYVSGVNCETMARVGGNVVVASSVTAIGISTPVEGVIPSMPEAAASPGRGEAGHAVKRKRSQGEAKEPVASMPGGLEEPGARRRSSRTGVGSNLEAVLQHERSLTADSKKL
jgi:hypothetical protein